MTDDLYRLIIDALGRGPMTREELSRRVDATEADVDMELAKLTSQKVATREGPHYALAAGFEAAGDPSLAEQEERGH